MYIIKYLAIVSFIGHSFAHGLTTFGKSNSPSSGDTGYRRTVSSDRWYPREYRRDRLREKIEVYALDITANVSNRFCRTTISSKVKNLADVDQEYVYSAIIPANAYVSNFTIETDGKIYESYVVDEEETKVNYSDIERYYTPNTARNSNRFTVLVRLNAESKTIFHLTYEELLERKNYMYEIPIHLPFVEIVDHVGIKVNIHENSPLRFVHIPPLRPANDIFPEDKLLDLQTYIDIQMNDDNSASITFNPDIEVQKKAAVSLGTSPNGHFIVQYDVKRDNPSGEILLNDRHFVQFFAPDDIEPLPKHVVFILDWNYRMSSILDQIGTGIKSILSQLRSFDTFSIVDFGKNVRVWNVKELEVEDLGEEPIPKLDAMPKNASLFEPVVADAENVKKASSFLSLIQGMVSTSRESNTIGALEAGLYLARNAKKSNNKVRFQPLIILISNRQDNFRMYYDDEEIYQEVEKLNKEDKFPIFTVTSDKYRAKEFMRLLSLKNSGFTHQLYTGGDVDLQLEQFYRQISSPLLSNIRFHEEKSVSQTSRQLFPMYFAGREIAIAGKYTYRDTAAVDVPSKISAMGSSGSLVFTPEQKSVDSDLERLYAYLTIKQRLEMWDSEEESDATDALSLSMKYSFLSPLMSMVVVMPDGSNILPYYQDANEGRIEESTNTRM